MVLFNPRATALAPAAITAIAGLLFAGITGGLAGLVILGYMMLIWLSLVTPIVAAALSVQRRSIERGTTVGKSRVQVVATGAVVVALAFVAFPTFSFLVTAFLGVVTGSGWVTSHFTVENAVVWWTGGAPLAGLYLAALVVAGIITTRTDPADEFVLR